jgi:hypothetical protein
MKTPPDSISMKPTRKPPGISGSGWQRINDIFLGRHRYSPKAIARRQARSARQKGANAA